MAEEVSSQVVTWAKEKMVSDGEYIHHAAQFGSPVVRSIANMILSVAEKGEKLEVKKEGK